MTETAFFAFDTNAEAVAKRIAKSMALIQAELQAASEKSGGIQLGRAGGAKDAAAGLTGYVKALENSNAQINALVANSGNGVRAAKNLNSELTKLSTSGFAQVQQSQLRELLRGPADYLRNLNLAEVGRLQGKGYVDNIAGELRRLKKLDPTGPLANVDINKLARAARKDVAQRAQEPLTLPQDASRIDVARLAAFKEGLAVSAGKGELSREQIRGIHPSLEREIFGSQGPVKPDKTGALIGGGDPHLSQFIESGGKGAQPAAENLKRLVALRDEERASAKKANDAELADAYRINDVKTAQMRDLANAENKAYDQRRANTRDLANIENKAYDKRRADTRDEANRLNAHYKAQQTFAAAETKVKEAAYAKDRDLALKENARLEGQRVATQGKVFGGYGQLGSDFYNVDKRTGAATRISEDQPSYYNQKTAAIQAQTKAQKALYDQEVKQQNLDRRKTGSFGSNISSGLFGRGINAGVGGVPNIREGINNQLATLGTVARYSGVYAVLGAISGAIADTSKEVLDFRDSLTDLQVAMATSGGSGASAQLVDQLQQIAVLSGSNTGAALDAAARGMRAFGDVTKASGGDVSAAGVDIADAATKISLITGKDLRDATGDVIAIASAFGLAASQANEVVNAVSAAKDFGGDPTNISQGLANFATTAGAAGFTLGEAANALSLVIARTDQSGQAAATRLSRITSILAGTTGRAVIADLNDAGLRDKQGQKINPEASVKEQLRQIAEAYQTAAPELQGKIRSALGGTSNLRELLPLLEPGAFDKIIAKGGDQAGRGDEEVRRKTTDLVGQIRKIQGDISRIQVNLFRSGAFQGVGVFLHTLEPALAVVGRLIGLLDRMPGIFKDTLGVILDIKVALVALRALGVLQSSSLLDLVAPRRAGVVSAAVAGNAEHAYQATSAAEADLSLTADARAAAGADALAISMARATVTTNELALSQLRAAGANTDEAASAIAAAEANLANAQVTLETAALKGQQGLVGAGERQVGGGGFLKGLGIMAAISAGVFLASEVFQSFDKNRAVAETGRKNSASIAAGDVTTSGGATAIVGSLAANAAELRKSQMGHSLSSLLVKDQRDKEIADTHAQESSYKNLAKRLAAEEKYGVGLQKTTLYGAQAASSVEDVNAAFKKLSDSGYDAFSQFNTLIDAVLKKPGTTGKVALPTDSPQRYAADLSQNVLKQLPAAAKGLQLDDLNRIVTTGGRSVQQPGGGVARPALTTEALAKNAATRLVDAQKAGAAKLASFKLDEGVAPSAAQQKAIEDAIIKAYGFDKLGADSKKFIARVRAGVAKYAQQQADIAGAAPGTGERDPAGAAKAISESIIPAYTAGLANLPASDHAGRLKAGAQLIQALKVVQAEAQAGSTGSADDRAALENIARQLAVQEETYSASVISEMEILRKAKQVQTKGKANIKAVGTDYFKQEVATAVDNGNLDALVDIFDKANRIQIGLAIAAQQTVVATKRAALAAAKLLPGGAEGRDAAIAGAQADLDEALKAMGLLKGARRRSTAPATGGDFESGKDAASKQGLTRAQIAAAKFDANVDPHNALQQAAADKLTAAANLEAADVNEDPGAYYAAKKALLQAQVAYADLVSSEAAKNKFNAARLRSDLTDPLAQARIDTKEAADKLRRDRAAGLDKNTIQEDKLNLRGKQSAQIGIAFEQRLKDAQNAESLGTMSHQAYIKYLNHEHDRLTSIKDKSRQQIDQLTEIDQALKAATEQMSGQFNLGDIKVPTPYEARRAMGASGGPGPAIYDKKFGTSSNNTVTNIHVDGADTVQIEKVLTRILGPLKIERTTPSKSRKR